MSELELADLNGSVTLVTGATGGLGIKITKDLIDYGQEVHVLGRNLGILDQLRDLQAKSHCVDISDEDQVKKFSKIVPRLDNIILCHGINGPRPLRMCTKKYAANVLDINLLSTIDLLGNLIRSRKIKSPGRIVYLSSISARMASANTICYSASKSAMESVMNGLARDLIKKEITVNSVCPAAIETPIFGGNKPSVLNDRNYPLGLGLPSDVSNTVLFLLQRGSRFITGESIILDGGATWLD